jgi:tRNA modification GTPase
MSLDLDDTIVAIASAPGGGLRGIVRLSGPGSAACVARVFSPAESALGSGSGVFGAKGPPILKRQTPPKTPDPLSVQHPCVLGGELMLLRGLGVIPARLYLWPDRRSYTRQPSAELHTVCSPPILEAIVESLCQAGARMARPGEFTLRAFLAGRLDLTQAEAVLGVIDARGQAQLHAALAQLAGGLAGPLAALRARLLDLLAHLEAGLDFVDEDIEFITAAELAAQLAAAADEADRLAQRMQSRRDASELPRVVLAGPPNAGKSSLLNALAGSPAAIVSEIAGTTRDYVTCHVTADGQKFLLVDTAGVVQPSVVEPSEAVAVERESQVSSERQRQEADVIVDCREVCEGGAGVGAFRCDHAPYLDERDVIQVWTKCDLAAPPSDDLGLETSSATGAGIADLLQAICRRLEEKSADAVLSHTAARCGESLDLSAAALARARNLAAAGAGEELVAAELRAALDGLGQVAGAVYTDDVLDRVFNRFCIGK